MHWKQRQRCTVGMPCKAMMSKLRLSETSTYHDELLLEKISRWLAKEKGWPQLQHLALTFRKPSEARSRDSGFLFSLSSSLLVTTRSIPARLHKPLSDTQERSRTGAADLQNKTRLLLSDVSRLWRFSIQSAHNNTALPLLAVFIFSLSCSPCSRLARAHWSIWHGSPVCFGHASVSLD